MSKSGMMALVLAATGFAATAHADKAAGDSCAAQLTPDGKMVYADSMAEKPTVDTRVDIVERVTRSLAMSRKINPDVARDNGVAAALCIQAALQ